ncbi:MAG TPA: putative quinol monooxygenase [Propionibacteriaceae bacterium]
MTGAVSYAQEVALFSLVVRFTVLPDHLEAFDALVAETVRQIRRHEPGTASYLTHTRDERPDERVFYEAYADHDAFLAHEQTPHTRHFLAERGQHLAADPEVWWLTTQDDSGQSGPS